MTTHADGFDVHDSKIAQVHASIEHGFGHINIYFRNVLPDTYSARRTAVRLTSQASTRDYGDESERGKGHIYAVRFGVTVDEASLSELKEASKFMTRIERRLDALAKKHGSVPWEADFVTFALRHISATGVDWVVFNDGLDPKRFTPNVDQLPRTRAVLTHEVGSKLQEMADKMVERFTRVAA